MHQKRHIAEEDDINLEEGDAVVRNEGMFPSINFSPRILKILDESLKNTVVVKLLGGPTSCHRLRDSLLRLWKFAPSFKLSDLEGGCFTTTFPNEEDYHRVLTEGPWVIVGNYFTKLDPSRTQRPGLLRRITHQKRTLRQQRLPPLPMRLVKASLMAHGCKCPL
ncbi:hypothetical protein K1719_014798 [Acacia pycnantha]|nr:hypothetical protein K1719_014798 [Acacia pycnantha]